MALDPYRRKMRARYQRGVDEVPERSRIPLVVTGFGLVAMLALVYYLSVTAIDSTTAQLFAWHIQPPP